MIVILFCAKYRGLIRKTKRSLHIQIFLQQLDHLTQCPDIPITTPPTILQESITSCPSTFSTDDFKVYPESQDNNPRPLTESKLNDLVHDLALIKEVNF